jgi:hypothetical protein
VAVTALTAGRLGERPGGDEHHVDVDPESQKALAPDLAGDLIHGSGHRVGDLAHHHHPLRALSRFVETKCGETPLAQPLHLEEERLEVAGIELLPPNRDPLPYPPRPEELFVAHVAEVAGAEQVAVDGAPRRLGVLQVAVHPRGGVECDFADVPFGESLATG